MEGHPVGHVDGFGFLPDPLAEGDETQAGAARRPPRAARGDAAPRRRALEAAPDGAFALAAEPRASPGTACRSPGCAPGPPCCARWCEVLDSEFLDGAQRERVRARLQALRRWPRCAADLAPLFAALAAGGDAARALRGPLHRLGEGLGVVPRAPSARPLAPALRGRLQAIGVRAGRLALFLPALLKPRAGGDAGAAVGAAARA